MFFILSKLLVIFLYPLTWIFLLLLAGLLVKKPKLKKRLFISSFVLLLLFTNPLLMKYFAEGWDIETTLTDRKYNCAIILGGFASEDNMGNGFFNGASDRFIQAVKLKKTDAAEYILVTGGSADIFPDGFSEGRWTKDEFLKAGLDEKSILIEGKARNTLENVKFSMQLLKDKNIEPPYLLVTSAFHMRRSLLTFKKAGVHVDPYSCNYIEGHNKISFDSFIPSARVLASWNVYIKEVVGYIVYALKA